MDQQLGQKHRQSVQRSREIETKRERRSRVLCQLLSLWLALCLLALLGALALLGSGPESLEPAQSGAPAVQVLPEKKQAIEKRRPAAAKFVSAADRQAARSRAEFWAAGQLLRTLPVRKFPVDD